MSSLFYSERPGVFLRLLGKFSFGKLWIWQAKSFFTLLVNSCLVQKDMKVVVLNTHPVISRHTTLEFSVTIITFNFFIPTQSFFICNTFIIRKPIRAPANYYVKGRRKCRNRRWQMIESKREHKENFRIARLFLCFPFYLGPSRVLVHGNRQLAMKSAERSGFKKLTHLRRY